MIEPSMLKIRNIRYYKKNYVVRIMRRKKTLKEAKALERYLLKFINCVNTYQDQTQGTFIVQTYKEYRNVEDAIKIRDFIESAIIQYNKINRIQ